MPNHNDQNDPREEEPCGMRGDINDAKTDYDDIIQAIRRTRDTEAETTLQKMGADLRQELVNGRREDTITQMKAMPAYAALAFRKQLQFTSNPLRKKVASQKKTGAEAIDWLRAEKAVKIHPDAAPAWKALQEYSPDTAWAAIRLNAMGDPQEQQYVNPDQSQDEDEPEEI